MGICNSICDKEVLSEKLLTKEKEIINNDIEIVKIKDLLKQNIDIFKREAIQSASTPEESRAMCGSINPSGNICTRLEPIITYGSIETNNNENDVIASGSTEILVFKDDTDPVWFLATKSGTNIKVVVVHGDQYGKSEPDGEAFLYTADSVQEDEIKNNWNAIKDTPLGARASKIDSSAEFSVVGVGGVEGKIRKSVLIGRNLRSNMLSKLEMVIFVSNLLTD